MRPLRREFEPRAVPVIALTGYGFLKIEKLDTLILRNAVVDLIDIIVDGLIHRFDPVLHEDLAIEELRLMDAGKLLNLLDE